MGDYKKEIDYETYTESTFNNFNIDSTNDTYENNEKEKDITINDICAEIIKENKNTAKANIITEKSFMTNRKMENTINKMWKKEEIAMFYDCIREFGMDFAIIAEAFKRKGFKKNRKQIISKYKKEEKINSDKISSAYK